MPLGEKVAEDNGKVMGATIKSIGPDGVTMELNYAGELKGMGRYPSGRYIGTATSKQGPAGISRDTNHGVFTTSDGEMIVFWTSGVSRAASGKSRVAELVSFMTGSQKYAWMNTAVLFRESEGSQGQQDFAGTSYEWK